MLRRRNTTLIKSLVTARCERDRFTVPKSVQKSIPIKKIYKDGIFQVSGKFSKTWRFLMSTTPWRRWTSRWKCLWPIARFSCAAHQRRGKNTLFNRKLNPKELAAACSCRCRAMGATAFAQNTRTLFPIRQRTATISFREIHHHLRGKEECGGSPYLFSRVGTDLTAALPGWILVSGDHRQ